MRITYDESARAMYVYVQNNKNAIKCIPMGPATINIDLDEDGEVVGFEFLFYSKLGKYHKEELDKHLDQL